MLLQHTYQVTWKAASFEWVLEYEKALPFGPYHPPNPMALEMSVTDRYAVWRFCQTPIGVSQREALSSPGDNSPLFDRQLLDLSGN